MNSCAETHKKITLTRLNGALIYGMRAEMER